MTSEFQPYRKRPVVIQARRRDAAFTVETLEGVMTGKPGDYEMIGVKGERYICDAAIFAETYDPVIDETEADALRLWGKQFSPRDD